MGYSWMTTHRPEEGARTCRAYGFARDCSTHGSPCIAASSGSMGKFMRANAMSHARSAILDRSFDDDRGSIEDRWARAFFLLRVWRPVARPSSMRDADARVSSGLNRNARIARLPKQLEKQPTNNTHATINMRANTVSIGVARAIVSILPAFVLASALILFVSCLYLMNADQRTSVDPRDTYYCIIYFLPELSVKYSITPTRYLSLSRQ